MNNTIKQYSEVLELLKSMQQMVEDDGEVDFTECRARVRTNIINAVLNSGKQEATVKSKEETVRCDAGFDARVIPLVAGIDAIFTYAEIWDAPLLVSIRFCTSGTVCNIVDAIKYIQAWISQSKLNIVNYTKHAVTVYSHDGKKIRVFDAIDKYARVQTSMKVTSVQDGVELFDREYIDLVDLPEEKENTVYIVSEITARCAYWRTDLYIPSGRVRDKAGNIIGCYGLARNVWNDSRIKATCGA